MITANARGQQISMTALNKIKTDPPDGIGKRWSKIPFGKLISCLQHELEEQRWTINLLPQIFVSQNHLDMAAEIEVFHLFRPVPEQDSCWTLGIKHSNGRRQSTRVYCGLSLGDDTGFVGMDWGSNKNKPLINDIKRDSKKIVEWFTESQNMIKDTIIVWQNRPMDTQTASRLLIKAGEQKILFPSGIYHAIANYEKLPELDHTVWELHRCFAQQNKRSPPLKQMQCLSNFRSLIEEELYKV